MVGRYHPYQADDRWSAGGRDISTCLLGADRMRAKTSLIKLIAGLDPLASRQGADGRTGREPQLSTQKRNVSLVHQFFVNYPHMTVFENIASPLQSRGDGTKRRSQGRVEQAADLLQLRPMLAPPPTANCRGGQQQRYRVGPRDCQGKAVQSFLDEPLANLDYKLREELREQLPELLAGRGSVVVYATSEPEEALLLGGRDRR